MGASHIYAVAHVLIARVAKEYGATEISTIKMVI